MNSEQHESNQPPASEPEPGFASVRQYLVYGLSIPERALRTGVGVVGGAVRESASLLVPQAFQNSQTYTVMVRQMLDYLVEDVGGVARDPSSDAPPPVENFVARKAVGNFVEMASLATMHISPLTLLAVVSDVAYGSKVYVRQLADELKKEGVIAQESTIDGVDDLLGAVANASRVSAEAFDTPPMSVAGLRKTIEETRKAVTQIDPTVVIPQAELDRLWKEMQEVATQQNTGLLEISGVMTLSVLDKIGSVSRGALSTVKVAGILFDRHVIDHYENALGEIGRNGIYATLAATSEPYIEAVWLNFSSTKPTITEGLVTGKLVGEAAGAVRRWLGWGESQEQPPSD